MALPPGVPVKTVTIGIASFFDGSLADGTVTITAPANVIHTPTNRPIFSSSMSKRFVDGEASFNLAPTDAAGFNRRDFSYKMNVVITGALVQPDPIYFLLPESGPDTVDLDGLVTVPSSAGVPISVDVLTAEDITNPTSDVNASLRAAFASAGGSPTASLALTPPRPRRQLIQTFQSGHGWGGLGAGTFNVNDTADFTIGSQSVRIQTAGASGGGSNLYKWGGSAVNLTGKNLALLLKIEDSTHLQSLSVQIGTGSMAANTYLNFLSFAGTDQSLGPDGKWFWVTIPWTPSGGSPDRSAITDFTIGVNDDGTTPVVVHVQALAAVPIPTAWTNGALTFSFDDGFASQYSIARPALAKYDFPADVYPVCEAIDTPGFMTTAQLQELQNTHGWLIGAHADTWSHHNVQPTTEAEVDTFYRATRDWLTARSLRGIDFFAYPRGDIFGPNLTLARRYFVAARSLNQRTRETLPASDPHLLRVLLWEAATTVAALTAEIDSAYANNYHLVLIAHDIAASGATGGSINAATFTQVADYAATKGIPVKTTAEVFATR